MRKWIYCYSIILFLSVFIIPQIDGNNEILTNRNKISPENYTPIYSSLNIKEQMTLSPMFTPDNALDIHEAWMKKATISIEIQNQYITQFDRNVDWANDPSPIVRELVNAANRGVSVRVQVREKLDSDDITSYLNSLNNIEVRWMGNSSSSPDSNYLSTTHNKLMIIDHKVTLISSINFGENAFTNNREAGIVIQSNSITNYYLSVFEDDWADGEIPPPSLYELRTEKFSNVNNRILSNNYPSHTNIPTTNFSGMYNVTAFVNPDNADQVVFDYLKSAKKSIYISMYTISREDFTNTLIDLKKSNPSIDIQVLISERRVGHSENVDTRDAVEKLVANLIPVYNSTTDNDKVDGFYHNKYWIIDGKHIFVYSGNWSPRSVTAKDTLYSSGETNRDMGIAIHDAPDIASFFKTEVWDKDVNVASAWDLPIGIKQSSFESADVVSGEISLNGQVTGLENASVHYKWGSNDYRQVVLSNNAFTEKFDTTTLENGISTFTVKAKANGQVYTDTVTVNIVNYPSSDNWRFLITEILPNPEGDDATGEFIELTNSFPFALLIEKWQAGDDTNLLTFADGYQIDKYNSIIIARNKEGFKTTFSKTAEFELGMSLKNSGDYIQLLDNRRNFVDVIAYGISAPDGSEEISIPGSGESIQRRELHIDANKASDFSIGIPDPKGNVPIVKLGSINLSSEGLTEAPLIFPWKLIIVAIIPIIRKRKNN